jgi:hypothetical protein
MKPNTGSDQRTRKHVDHTKRNRKKKAKTGGQMQDHKTMPNVQKQLEEYTLPIQNL